MPEDEYTKPPKDIFNDVLKSADKKIESNKQMAQWAKEREDKKKALRDELQIKCDDAKQVLRDKYEGHLLPILAALESLPDKDGKKFHVKTSFDDGGIDAVAEGGNAKNYKGPSLSISVFYGDNWNGASMAGTKPLVEINIGPDRYMPHEEITVTRHDHFYPQWSDQGGDGPAGPDRSQAYGYESLRQKIGEWLGEVAPDRMAELAAAAKNPPAPKGPAVAKPPFNKYKGGSLKKE